MINYLHELGINEEHYTLFPVSGGTEGYLQSQLFDYCDAIVETGKTLEDNNLEIVKVLCDQVYGALYTLDDWDLPVTLQSLKKNLNPIILSHNFYYDAGALRHLFEDDFKCREVSREGHKGYRGPNNLCRCFLSIRKNQIFLPKQQRGRYFGECGRYCLLADEKEGTQKIREQKHDQKPRGGKEIYGKIIYQRALVNWGRRSNDDFKAGVVDLVESYQNRLLFLFGQRGGGGGGQRQDLFWSLQRVSPDRVIKFALILSNQSRLKSFSNCCKSIIYFQFMPYKESKQFFRSFLKYAGIE